MHHGHYLDLPDTRGYTAFGSKTALMPNGKYLNAMASLPYGNSNAPITFVNYKSSLGYDKTSKQEHF